MAQKQKQLSHFRCPGCRELLPQGRANLKFHGSACRARFWRRLRDIGFHSQLAQQYIADWNDSEVISVRHEELLAEIKDIRATLDDLERSIHAHFAAEAARVHVIAEASQG